MLRTISTPHWRDLESSYSTNPQFHVFTLGFSVLLLLLRLLWLSFSDFMLLLRLSLLTPALHFRAYLEGSYHMNPHLDDFLAFDLSRWVNFYDG